MTGRFGLAFLMDLVNEVEERCPVDRWQVGGVHVWPLIRVWLYMHIRDWGLAAELQGTWSVRPSVAVYAVRSLLRRAIAVWKDRLSDAELRPAHALFLGDQLSRVWLEDTWYDRLCEPLMLLLAHRRLTWLHLEPYHDYRVPRHAPSMFIQSRLDLERAKARLALFFNPASLKLEGFDEFLAVVSDRVPNIPCISASAVARLVAEARSIAEFFAGILAKVRPSVAFCVEYYSLTGMAFNLACRAAGVKTVEIPHGNHGDLHVAYSRWNRVPVGGYEMLPAYFWCWSEAEASVISGWSRLTDQHHTPVVGGSPWLRYWHEDTSDLVVAYDRKLRAVCDRFPASLDILLTYELDMRRIVSLVRTAPTSWRWWVRLHPTKLTQRSSVRRMLEEQGIRNFDLDSATDYPLYALLRHVDVHVTECSSVTTEAMSFSVPTIVTDPYGLEALAAQISSGWAHPARTDQEVVSLVVELARAERPLRARNDGTHTAPTQALDLILASAGLTHVLAGP